jgi:nuclear transport factor 2 (NTF2) superfamily protein
MGFQVLDDIGKWFVAFGTVEWERRETGVLSDVFGLGH